MTADQRSPGRTVWNTVLALVLPLILILAGASLMRTAISLPFEAGSPFVDLLVPVGAVGFGVAGFVTAARGRRTEQGRRGIQALFVVEAVLATLVILAGMLTVLLIFGLCGFYWTRETC